MKKGIGDAACNANRVAVLAQQIILCHNVPVKEAYEIAELFFLEGQTRGHIAFDSSKQQKDLPNS